MSEAAQRPVCAAVAAAACGCTIGGLEAEKCCVRSRRRSAGTGLVHLGEVVWAADSELSSFCAAGCQPSRVHVEHTCPLVQLRARWKVVSGFRAHGGSWLRSSGLRFLQLSGCKFRAADSSASEQSGPWLLRLLAGSVVATLVLPVDSVAFCAGRFHACSEW